MWKALRGPASRSAALPGAAADADARDPGRQAARQAVAHHHARSGGAAAARPGRARLHAPRRRTGSGSPTSPTCAAGRALVFFAFVIDVFSRARSSAGSSPANMRTDLVLDALRMALGQRDPGADVALVHHSDRGSQYTSIDYTQTLDDHGVLASVGIGRRRLRQRAGRELRRQLQDRADRRPRLAHPLPARARRSSSTSAGSTTTACTRRSATSHPPSSKHTRRRRIAALALRARCARHRHQHDRPDYAHSENVGTQLTRSPSNPVRLRSAVRSEWRLITATHNLLKLHKHHTATAAA